MEAAPKVNILRIVGVVLLVCFVAGVAGGMLLCNRLSRDLPIVERQTLQAASPDGQWIARGILTSAGALGGTDYEIFLLTPRDTSRDRHKRIWYSDRFIPDELVWDGQDTLCVVVGHPSAADFKDRGIVDTKARNGIAAVTFVRTDSGLVRFVVARP